MHPPFLYCYFADVYTWFFQYFVTTFPDSIVGFNPWVFNSIPLQYSNSVELQKWNVSSALAVQQADGNLFLKPALSTIGNFFGTGSVGDIHVTPLPAVVTTKSTCDAAAGKYHSVYIAGDYALLNGIVTAGTVQPTEGQCISATSVVSTSSGGPFVSGVTASITWNWGGSNPVTSPLLEYRPNGQDPSINVSDIGNLAVHHDVTVSATGQHYLLYHFWMASSSSASIFPPKADVLVQFAPGYSPSPSDTLITLGGVQYAIRLSKNVQVSSTYAWDFAEVKAINAPSRVDLPLKPLFDYLIASGFSLPTDYIRTMQFGGERLIGSGKMTVNSFSVTH